MDRWSKLLWAVALALPAVVLLAGGPWWAALLAAAPPAALALGYVAGRRSAGAPPWALLDALDDGVTMIDRRQRLSYANPRAKELLGLPPGPLRHTGFSDFAWTVLGRDGEALATEERPAWITARTGRPCRMELGIRRADGTMRWVATVTQALPESPGDSGPYAVLVSFSDVTERREAVDALERSNAELAQFAYVASHDLSEPLRMVSSYLQLLRRRYAGRLDRDADEFIDYAVDGANRMRALIEDLLAYSRAGRHADPEPIDCEIVIGTVVSSLAVAIAEARARVSVGRLPVVIADRVELAQLFQNLVANALKFRRGPGAQVWVTAEQSPPGWWTIAVADDGIGIEPRHGERVFKMFQRLHGHDSYEGTGIGLAICRKIVERHGGRIWLEPRDGGGTVFRFTLPAAADDTVVEPAPADRAPAAAPA
jgi:PAS domain S-box-containing protein